MRDYRHKRYIYQIKESFCKLHFSTKTIMIPDGELLTPEECREFFLSPEYIVQVVKVGSYLFIEYIDYTLSYNRRAEIFKECLYEQAQRNR